MKQQQEAAAGRQAGRRAGGGSLRTCDRRLPIASLRIWGTLRPYVISRPDLIVNCHVYVYFLHGPA